MILIALGWIAILVGIPSQLQHTERRPADMPANSVWIDAPAVPFDFYRGWWVGCWVETDVPANRCRLYSGSLNPHVVYEGRYLPCGGKVPIPVKELKLKAPRDSLDMWLHERIIVFLEDGRLLVPVENLDQCETIRNRLANGHKSNSR